MILGFLVLVIGTGGWYVSTAERTAAYAPAGRPCGLLDPSMVAVVVPAPVPRPDAADPLTCRWTPGDDAPDQPASRIALNFKVTTGDSSAEQAGKAYEDAAKNAERGGRTAAPLDGLGKEAVVLTGQKAAEGEGTVLTRAGNVVLDVTYAEESGSASRVAEVAQILAREALRRAIGDDDALDDGGSGRKLSRRQLAAVPRSPLPLASRFARYRPVRQPRVVVGRTWRSGDRTKIQDLGYPFVFKTPAGLACTEQPRPGAWACSGATASKGRTSSMRAYVVVRKLPRDVVRWDGTWPERPVGQWQDLDNATRYEEVAGAGARRVYRLTMSHMFRSGGKRYHVGVQASVPADRKGLARKTVNDIRNQAPAIT